jgi:CheY-like chemotaxis protein
MPAPALPVVLLVEDEPIQRQLMAAALGQLGTVEVIAAATVEEAVRALDTTSPELVIADIDLPDRPGFELLGELAARGQHPFVVFASAYLSAYRAQIPRNPRIEVLEKPVALEALRKLVRGKVGRPRAEPQLAAPFGLADFLQMAGMGRRSAVLEVWRGRRLGKVLVVNGEAWSASDAEGEGPAAFNRLFAASDAMVRCLAVPPSPGPRNLEGSVEGLLLEAARLQDEAARPEGEAAPKPNGADHF